MSASTPQSDRSAVGPDAAPLEGIRVIELDAGYVNYTGKILADFGATVIKVEPPGGVAQRRSAPFHHALDGSDYSIPFTYYNAGKKSVVLDLSDPVQLATLEGLITEADVLLDGLGLGATQALGLSSERLGELAPGLIHLIVTPFGQTGPWRHHLSSDVVALTVGGVTGQSGYDSVNGRPSQAISPTGGQSQHFAGVLAAIATIAALQENRTEGVRTLDFAQHDAIAVSTESYISMWEFGRAQGFRHTGQHASADFTPPVWQFRCQDGAYLCALTLYLNDRRFAALIDLFDANGFEHRLSDERYVTMKQRQEVMNEIVDVIAAFALLHPAQYIFDEAQKRQLPWSKVRRPEDVATDEHLRARGFYSSIELFPGEEVLFPGVPWQGLPSVLLAHAKGTTRTRPPQVGEDTESVLAAGAPRWDR
jgi:crotonobetainyl-CoA:carnitine CoA-transferase CaiB-like acyl-CoA transferase